MIKVENPRYSFQESISDSERWARYTRGDPDFGTNKSLEKRWKREKDKPEKGDKLTYNTFGIPIVLSLLASLFLIFFMF